MIWISILAMMLGVLSPFMFKKGMVKSPTLSTVSTKTKDFGHFISNHWGKLISVLILVLLWWATPMISEAVRNRPPPPPPKVYEPTEVLYILDIRNDEGNLVDYEGNVIPSPEEYFAVTVKGLDYFEGWYPRVNSMKPNKDKLVFSQSFGDKFGVWKDTDGRSKNVKHRGTIQILRDLEYIPDKIGPIRGIFWKEGLDPSKRDGSFNFTLYPPKSPTPTRTLEYWD